MCDSYSGELRLRPSVVRSEPRARWTMPGSVSAARMNVRRPIIPNWSVTMPTGILVTRPGTQKQQRITDYLKISSACFFFFTQTHSKIRKSPSNGSELIQWEEQNKQAKQKNSAKEELPFKTKSTCSIRLRVGKLSAVTDWGWWGWRRNNKDQSVRRFF